MTRSISKRLTFLILLLLFSQSKSQPENPTQAPPAPPTPTTTTTTTTTTTSPDSDDLSILGDSLSDEDRQSIIDDDDLNIDVTKLSWEFNLQTFFEDNLNSIPIIRKNLLIGKKTYKTIGREFVEYYDFYYHIPTTLHSFSQAKKVCRGKRATIFEFETIRRYQAIATMKDASKNFIGNRAFWINVQNTLEDRVEYVSNEQLLSVVPGLPRFQVPLQIAKPNCLLFDPSLPNYKITPCTSKELVICIIEKSDTLLTALSLHNLIDDKLADLNRLKLTTFQKDKIIMNFNSLDQDTCGPRLTQQSLINILGLLNTIVESNSDPIDLANLIPRLLEDVLTVKTLVNKNTFHQQIRDLLSVGTNLKLVIDKTRNLLCTKIDNTPSTQTPGLAIPTQTSNTTSITTQLPDLFKFNLTEIILAITSSIVTVIAVTNSICLLYMNKDKLFQTQNDVENSNSPLRNSARKKGVTFSDSNFELVPLSSKTPSMATLPSPQPFRN